MKTVLINDMRSDINVLAVDLRHVLAALGERATSSEWRVRDVWAIPDDSGAELARLEDSATVSGHRLRELAEAVTQVIDGVFSGFEPGAVEPWVIIEVVDSSHYLVRSDDPSVLDEMKSTFREVSEYEERVT